MGSVPGGYRLVIARENLSGYRGLTLDGFGALLQGGPDEVPRVVKRLLSDRGQRVNGSVRDSWRKALRTQYASDPFISFREVHRHVVQEMLTRFGIQGDLDPYINEAFDEYRRARAYPEVSSVLQDLERDVAMAVVSNMDTAILLEALHHNGLSFTFVVTSEEEQRYKPHPSIFQRAIRYLGLPAANVLHVGDSYHEDVVGATAVGMGSMLMQRSAPMGNRKTGNGSVVHDLHDVRAFIRKSWS